LSLSESNLEYVTLTTRIQQTYGEKITVNISDLRLFHPEVIDIDVDHREQAIHLSHQVVQEDQQWSVYLHGLALEGFNQWLQQQGDYTIDLEHCSILNPIYASVVDAVCNLKINGFNVCLIATEHLIDEVITIPSIAVDLPDFAAHIYVLLEVWEEQDKILLRGVIRHDELTHHRTTLNIQPSDDWTYSFPISTLELEPNYIRHYLQKLHPASISLPTSQPERTTTLQTVDIEALVNNLNQSGHSLWQEVSWEQGEIIVSSPALLTVLYQLQTQPEHRHTLKTRLVEVMTLLTQPAIDTALWLHNQMDELAQQLSFWTPSMMTPEFSLRGPLTFDQVITFLQENGLGIPENSQPMYRDIEVDDVALRLCSLVIPPSSNVASSGVSPQWSLLTILGTPTGHSLPAGTQLQVSKLTGVLEAPILEFDEPFLYAIADASPEEKLSVTIVMGDVSQTLEPYIFGQNRYH